MHNVNPLNILWHIIFGLLHKLRLIRNYKLNIKVNNKIHIINKQNGKKKKLERTEKFKAILGKS